ncbi:Smr/MutS family protein [Wolbachia endosymbiont of Atemnus politus]|uniref:Smr/MutS family protein n=1 Tax=Wolbachia endosymbiont of Atemnus politus TaxID=2682840 RepID=UPI001FE8956D|nr:Smr/MutS family protein [Wolbachia endosymbiont of Atemnus politus]
MSGDELNWQKNVRPIKCKKVTLKVDHKVNVRSIADKGTYNLQENFLYTNNGNLLFCLDYNTKSKVDRGKYSISDKLDLHDYNIEYASYRLMDFIIKNYRAGNRCLLIITGHGSATCKTDTIKNNLKQWLN